MNVLELCDPEAAAVTVEASVADAIRKILKAVGMPADWPQPAPSRWARQEELFAVA